MTDTKQSLAAKVMGVVTALAAAWLAQRIIDLVWTRTLGHKPPKPEDETDARLAEVAAAATITGAAVALSRVLATRGTAKFLTRH
jgi:H+/gluconate symporter-like permease